MTSVTRKASWITAVLAAVLWSASASPVLYQQPEQVHLSYGGKSYFPIYEFIAQQHSNTIGGPRKTNNKETEKEEKNKCQILKAELQEEVQGARLFTPATYTFLGALDAF